MDHVALCVNDFDRALAFFVGFLGFALEGEMDRRGEPALGTAVGLPGAVIRWAMLSHQGRRIELFRYYRPQGETRPRRQCDFGYSHIAFVVADVDAAYAEILAAGYRTVSPPQVLRGGRSKVVYVEEPEGAITEFVQWLDR